MLDVVREAINQFYIKKDHHSFKTLCQKRIRLPKELTSFINSQKMVLKKSFDDKTDPSKNWYIRVSEYKRNSFEILYKTKLEISKIIPLFHIESTFGIRNKGKEKMEPVLYGYDERPYSKKQARLEKQISAILSKSGYQRIYDNDLYMPIQGFNMPDGVTLFGSDVTPENLFFNDIYYFAEK